MSKDKVTPRLATKTSRPDFMSYILRYNDERGMEIPEIEVNAGIIIPSCQHVGLRAMTRTVHLLPTDMTHCSRCLLGHARVLDETRVGRVE
ncbi:uncharacterized protein N7498_003448 [Penicillium cinerascens]|uniref:Uncharacterized protein n=1 Tax=Penicillium cinerascens TaxID=70096 RepID=A0A9W9T6X0_9EURO|nr:uncharacterized protein N7498_003448 [Penicillium cinerascens]KAJ5211802.1 hypothetical protein N7498_003448 [Penicillium cinerascens]